MRIIAAVLLMLICVGASAQVPCDVALSTVVTIAGGVPVGEGVIKYYGLEPQAIADLEKALNRINDAGKKAKKGGQLNVALTYVKSCAGTDQSQTGGFSGMTFHDATALLRAEYKEGQAVLDAIDANEDKGAKGNPLKGVKIK